MYQRHQRVGSLIQEELTKLILKELEFNGALVTVTSVEVQKDLDYAVIGISVFPNEKFKKVMAVLEKNKRRLQHLLANEIEIRPMPEIRFEADKGLEHAAEVEKVLLEVEKKEGNK